MKQEGRYDRPTTDHPHHPQHTRVCTVVSGAGTELPGPQTLTRGSQTRLTSLPRRKASRVDMGSRPYMKYVQWGKQNKTTRCCCQAGRERFSKVRTEVSVTNRRLGQILIRQTDVALHSHKERMDNKASLPTGDHPPSLISRRDDLRGLSLETYLS